MKRILFICNGVSIGGAERVVSLLADSLINKGYEVFLLAFLQSDKTYELNPKINVIFAEKSKNKLKNKILRINSIRKNVIENKIDLVIAFSHYNVMSAVIALAGLQTKIIGSERNDPAQIKNRFILNKIREILYKKLDCLICQTEDAKQYFPDKIKKNIVVIPNPISNHLPSPYFGERENRIVSFSRFEEQKNIPMLIDAFSMFHLEYSDYKLDLYGEGSMKQEIIDYVRSKDLNDCINIHAFSTNIHQEVIKAKLFVLASDYEGLSNSMIEAMAIGIPTLVTDCPCGGARMVIKDGYNGYLVPVRDVNAMYNKMKFIIDNEEQMLNMGYNGTQIRNTLNKDKIADKWLRIIETLD